MGSSWSAQEYDDSIPEEHRIALQNRLRNLREVQGLIRTRTPYATHRVLQKWEDTDISGMKFSDIYRIADYMSWSMEETLAYFASSDETPVITRNYEKRMFVLLKNMPASFQDAACDIVERLLELHESVDIVTEVVIASSEDAPIHEPDLIVDLTREQAEWTITDDGPHRFSTQTFRKLFE